MGTQLNIERVESTTTKKFKKWFPRKYTDGVSPPGCIFSATFEPRVNMRVAA